MFSVARPVAPDQGCLWCNQLISPAGLQHEAATAGERRAQNYLDEPDVVVPSVITLNATAASQAANDFLFAFTGPRARVLTCGSGHAIVPSPSTSPGRMNRAWSVGWGPTAGGGWAMGAVFPHVRKRESGGRMLCPLVPTQVAGTQALSER